MHCRTLIGLGIVHTKCNALHCAIRPDIDSIQRSYRDLPITSLPPPPSPPHFLLIFSSLPSHFLLTSSSIFPQFLLTFRLSRISSVDWCFTRTPAGCLLLAGLLAAGLPLVAGPWSPGFQARRGLWPRPLHRYHMLHCINICINCLASVGLSAWQQFQLARVTSGSYWGTNTQIRNAEIQAKNTEIENTCITTDLFSAGNIKSEEFSKVTIMMSSLEQTILFVPVELTLKHQTFY